MMIAERIQALIHKLEVGGARRLNYVALTLAVLSLALWYDTHCYHNFNSPEAMDKAQVARNLSCLLYTSPSPRDGLLSRMPSSA